MNPARLIHKTRDGLPLSDHEMAALVDGYVSGHVHDYHMAAWAMAVFFRGLSLDETTILTERMWRSGRTLPRGQAGAARVGKHSTGGVGDKTSLVLVPLLAAVGLRVPKLSGRGLGATGGTLDKLEAIAGFRADLSIDEIERVVGEVGCVITGQTAEIVPADRLLYALRDVTATVESVPLITASVLSKKMAEGLDALVLDVKWGSGAFMPTRAAAAELAGSLVAVSRRLGLKTTALVSDMNQPLGRMVGNAVEAREAIDTLEGGGPDDLRRLVLALGSQVMLAGGASSSAEEAEAALAKALDDGRARERFERMVAAQGGNLSAGLRVAPAMEIPADATGFISAIDCRELGRVVGDMGGGRRHLGDAIDHSVGLELLAKIGDHVETRQPLARVFAPLDKAAAAAPRVRAAFLLSPRPTPPPPLICDVRA